MDTKTRLFIFFFCFINASNASIEQNIINFFTETKCFEDKNLPSVITLPREIWEKILSFNPYDLHPELFLKIINLNKTIQDETKKIIEKNPEKSAHFFKNIKLPLESSLKSLDELIPFISLDKNTFEQAQSKVTDFVINLTIKPFPNYHADLEELVIKAINSIPLDQAKENTIILMRKNINIYRCLNNLFDTPLHIHNILTNRLELKNYAYFHYRYFGYVLKVLAYINCFNIFYLKKYLSIFDKRFDLLIDRSFLFVNSYKYNNLNNSFYPIDFYNYFFCEDAHCYSIDAIVENIENAEKNYIAGKKRLIIHSSISLFLNYLKKVRNCSISDAFIEYFKDPTIKTKNSLLKSLITVQSYIRKYNTESFVLHYPNSILTIQSYIRKRACYHKLIELEKIKTEQNIAVQTIQNHIRRLIAHKKMDVLNKINKLNAIITIQKYVRKMNSEILLEKLANQKKLHDSFLETLNLISRNRYKQNFYQQIKILFSGAGLLATCVILCNLICFCEKLC